MSDENLPKTSDDIIEEAKEELPINPDANPDIHPMAKGMRGAKACINEILKDEDNLFKLAMALQTEFDKDPVGFFERFEPLFTYFEKQSEDVKEERQGVRLSLISDDGDSASVEIVKETQ